MRFDFSYIKLVYDIIDGFKNINELRLSKPYEGIKSHGEMTFREYDSIVKAMISIKNKNHNKLANNLIKNRNKIFEILNVLDEKEEEVKNIIINKVKNIYPKAYFEDITIFLMVGYDAIALNGNVFCSIDFDFILENYRELISLLIHETTHVIHSQYCSKMNNINLQKSEIKDTLNFLIQAEGIAIFSAYEYRNAVDIFNNKDGFITQDYVNTVEKENLLRLVYKDTIRDIKAGGDSNIVLDKYFSHRVDHALGFIIFENMYRKFGIGIIREMAIMKNDDFVEKYL